MPELSWHYGYFGVLGVMVGIVLALGNSIGGYLGAHFAVTKGEGLIRLVLNLVLVAFIIKLLFT